MIFSTDKRVFGLTGSLVFAAFLASAGCGHSETEWQAQLRSQRELQGRFDTLTSERDRLQTELNDLTARVRQLDERLGTVSGERTALSGERDRLEREGAQAARELAELQRRQRAQEARLAVFRNMLGQFRSMISAGQLRVRVVNGRMIIELPAGILFDSGRAELRTEGQQVLTQVATVLQGIQGRDFLVAGHTDNQRIGRGGRYEDNWDLSAARAINVVRFLAQNQVSTARLGAAGYGEFQPAHANDTDENRALNRRVEIILMPNLDELPDLSSIDTTSGSAPTPTPAPAPPSR